MLTLNDGRSELWQWDTGRTLAVDADCSQVHFSNKVFGRSIDVDVTNGVAIIPDILLQTDKDLNVWAFVGTAENGYTKISKTFTVNRRNKPSDYVFTPADQMTLHTIQSQIGDLADLTTEAKDTLVAAINEAARTGGGGGGSTVELDTTLTKSGKAADAKAVGDALAGKQNTISDLEAIRTGAAKGATALQSVPITYRTASEQDTIDDSKVDKVTGKGLSSNDYTDAAKAKVDTLAPVATSGSYNDLTNKPTIPTALPNPNALTFTGAVTGSYDGSEPVSVEIPSGGGSGSVENWRLVNTVTTAEDVSDIRITQDSDGNPLSLKKVKIFAKVRGNSANLSTWCRITVNNLAGKFYYSLPNTFKAEITDDHFFYSIVEFSIYASRLMLGLKFSSLNNAASKDVLKLGGEGVENYPDVVDAITSIRMWSASAGIGAGTELMIYGVDA